jgi:hypothetical protein
VVGVLAWKNIKGVRVQGCSLCGWVSPFQAVAAAEPLDRAEALRKTKAAFKTHRCKDFPPPERSDISPERHCDKK